MRIICPSCGATYEVPDDRIGTGRRLRCARCKHDWFVTPPPPAAAPRPAPPAPSLAAPRTIPEAPPLRPDPARLPPPAEVPPIAAPGPETAAAPPVMPGPRPDPAPVSAPAGTQSGALRLAWAATALVILGVVAGLILYRVPIVEAWPPAERLYIALGLMPA